MSLEVMDSLVVITLITLEFIKTSLQHSQWMIIIQLIMILQLNFN
jgi:hypothetical protein